jgi:two-component system response regulator NreC
MNAQSSDVVVELNGNTRVLIVDSQAIVREGLSVLLALEDDLSVIGHAPSSDECLANAHRFAPDLIITELEARGAAAIEDLRRTFPKAIVLVLSVMSSEEAIRVALAAGAHGYVLKESGRIELLHGIRAVIGGTRFLCDRAAARVVSSYLGDSTQASGAQFSAPITRSERDILSMVARGLSNKHIARLRQRSVRTIEKQRAMLMRKLGLRNAADLTRFALENGLIPADAREHDGSSVAVA